MGPTDSNPTPAPGSFSFALLRREDLPLLDGWLAAEHVSPWFGWPANHEQDPLGELDAVRRFIASLDGRPIGMIQIYRWSDFPENASVVSARVGEVGIDYLIGEADLIGQGIGPSMVSAFLTRETFARGDVMGVRVDVSEANQRSWRCLEKLGFRRDQEGVEIPRQSGPHFYVRESDAVGASDATTVARVTALARSAPRLPGFQCRVVAIDGPAGAGKSALALRVARELGDAPVIHTDDFAAWDNQFGWYVRLIDQVLEPLARGSAARYQRYEWEKQRLAEWHQLEPREFLIIEGVGASRSVLRPYLSASVWVQTDRAERLRRGLARDGQDALSLWDEWMRGEDEYLAAEHPDQAADLVVSGEAGAAVADPGDADRPMTEQAVRRARPDEGPAIAEVWLQARRAPAIPPAVHSDDEVRAWISDVLLRSCEVWVAIAQDEVVGMMALEGEWVDQLYVLPEHQRHGHGRRLLERAMSERTTLTLWTFASNVGAQRFYEALGFAPTGPPSEDNEERAPAILYRWERSS